MTCTIQSLKSPKDLLSPLCLFYTPSFTSDICKDLGVLSGYFISYVNTDLTVLGKGNCIDVPERSPLSSTCLFSGM